MPLIKSAKKKLKQDKKRTVKNKKYELAYVKLIAKARKFKKGDKVGDLLKKAYQAIDKAKKQNVIHKNKAARLKGMVARLLSHSASKK